MTSYGHQLGSDSNAAGDVADGDGVDKSFISMRTFLQYQQGKAIAIKYIECKSD